MKRRARGYHRTLAALVTMSCATSSAYEWHEARYAPLPSAGLGGAPVVILPIGAVVAETGEAAVPGPVDSVIAATLSARVAGTSWFSAAAVRVRAQADRSMPHPDSLPMELLPFHLVKVVPQPLLGQMRLLVTKTRGKYILFPVRLTYRPGRGARAVRAEFTAVLVDTTVGVVAWKSDVAGEGDTPLAALTAALWVLTPRA